MERAKSHIPIIDRSAAGAALTGPQTFPGTVAVRLR